MQALFVCVQRVCRYDLQYRMELATQGMFFDDDEVRELGNC